MFRQAGHLAWGNVGVFAAVVDDFAVADFNYAVGVGGNARVVRYHNDGVALAVQIVQDFHHVFAAVSVERAGGFVGQNDFAAVHQGTRNAHPLLLPAGKLAGLVVFLALQTQIGQQLVGAAVARTLRHARIHRRQGHIVARIQRSEQIIALENKAETLAPQSGQCVVVHGGGFFAVDAVGAAAGCIQAAQNVHQRGLARAGLADNGHKIALGDAQIDVFEHLHPAFARAEMAVDAVNFN